MIASRPLFALLLAGLLSPVLQCTSSTTLVTSWHDQSYRSGALRKPLVLAVANKGVVRVKLEDALARGLRGIGVDAVASYTMFPQKDLTADTIKDKLPTTDRDSVMVTRLVDVKRETVVVPAETEVYPLGVGGYPAYYPAYASRWDTYYTQSYSVVSAPGYTYETKKYVLQTNLYEAVSEKLVWTAVTESEEPSSLDDAIGSFVGVIVKDVEKNRLF